MNEPQLTPLEYTFQLSPTRKCRVFFNKNWVVKINEDPNLIEENKLEATIEFNNEYPTE